MFVIHDALMVDVSRDSMTNFMKIVNDGACTPLGTLPLKSTNVIGEDI